MGQMLEALLTGLSHPNFDRNLPHQSILVVTGRLTGNAALSLQDLNATIQDTYQRRPITLWDREKLLENLEILGLEGVYRATASDFVSYGNFFILYGKCTQGNVSDREIELHSRHWLDESMSPTKGLLAAMIEMETIAQKCLQQGLPYEAIFAYLSVIRMILFRLHVETIVARQEELVDMYSQAKLKLLSACRTYLGEVRQSWVASEKDLVRVVTGPGGMFTYLVHCARIIEMAGALYFLEPDQTSKQDVSAFIDDFISREPGCAHIPSDRYAVSLVLPTLALYRETQPTKAQEILHRAIVWLCNRVQDGFGIAPFDSSPATEVARLLGHAFEFIPQQPTRGSLLATVLCDLAAFLGKAQFYSDIVNDIKACGIAFEYWQSPNTASLFMIDGPEVITYPNVEPKDNVGSFEEYDYAEHIAHEPRSFQIAELVGPFSLMSIMLLLRDRYFPTVWTALTCIDRSAD